MRVKVFEDVEDSGDTLTSDPDDVGERAVFPWLEILWRGVLDVFGDSSKCAKVGCDCLAEDADATERLSLKADSALSFERS